MPVPTSSEGRSSGLRRSPLVWQAVGLSLALMAPGMARRVGANLAAAEGLTLQEPATTPAAESIPGSDVRG